MILVNGTTGKVAPHTMCVMQQHPPHIPLHIGRSILTRAGAELGSLSRLSTPSTTLTVMGRFRSHSARVQQLVSSTTVMNSCGLWLLDTDSTRLVGCQCTP